MFHTGVSNKRIDLEVLFNSLYQMDLNSVGFSYNRTFPLTNLKRSSLLVICVPHSSRTILNR